VPIIWLEWDWRRERRRYVVEVDSRVPLMPAFFRRVCGEPPASKSERNREHWLLAHAKAWPSFRGHRCPPDSSL
jgi:hypothetical protein